MHESFRHFGQALLATTLLTGSLGAQTSRPARSSLQSPDVFAIWQQALNATVEKALATALAEKPWMKADQRAIGASGNASASEKPSVVQLRAAIQRVQQLRPIIEPILVQEGVPPELSAVVLVESGGQPTVPSPKGALGIWQFMPTTARHYGLTVTANLDERIDIAKSTHAAGRYLRDLYQEFGNWQLAFAAYNAGELTIAQALSRTRSPNFFSIERVLPLETRKYVPAVLNAMLMFGANPDSVFPPANVRRSQGQVVYASGEIEE